ncbi:thioredoxin domain-containing protein [Thermaerobacter sp. PB12/4term]|uniref:thioredoxin domain-containing protein n=1 Tax=Thermaerobacter sp. PB12/4term TaxID=2293838 RepID=UPI001FAB45FA|nr:thioredoxin domain-containing protein [Thermaerobacter sp. PB12/4term]
MASSGRRPNRLIHEASPYLQQHAYNPVDWYPWGPEALERARREDRPILLSIGYAACHWCHVMERECFEDPAIAARMNAGFVNVKVDREERPDLDQIYQTAAQILGSGGGWPLTVFVTPDLKPFFAGTYFPPEDRHGLPGFPKVLEAVLDAYRRRRDEVERVAGQVAEVLRRSVSGAGLLDRGTGEPAGRPGGPGPEGAAGEAGGAPAPGPSEASGQGEAAREAGAAPGRDGAGTQEPGGGGVALGLAPDGAAGREAARRWLEQAAARIARSYDPQYGGFGRAPKFPQATAVAVLLRAGAGSGVHHPGGPGTGTGRDAQDGAGDGRAPAAEAGPERGSGAGLAAASAGRHPAGGGQGPGPGSRRWLDMALHTLQAMALGGLFDHLAGGFHRYATDRAWLIPHFEKMLYDQAQLVPLYLDAYRITGDPFYAGVARRTLDFVREEMTAPEGGFISTLDADSDGREGAYYVWTPAQLREALEGSVASGARMGPAEGGPARSTLAATGLAEGSDPAAGEPGRPARAKAGLSGSGPAGGNPANGAPARTAPAADSPTGPVEPARAEPAAAASVDVALAARWFGVTEEGNFEDGTTVLYRAVADEERPALARSLGLEPAELDRRLQSIRKRLLEARRRRTPPARDDKILAGWNGLMIAAFAQAAPVLDEPGYAEAARRAAEFVLGALRRPDGRLVHAYRGRALEVPGFLQDYAFFIEGLLALHAAGGDSRWLDEADRLAGVMIETFWDEDSGLFYDAPLEAQTPLARPVELFDQAVPAGPAVAAGVLARLAVITGDERYRRVAGRFLDRVRALAAEQPLAMARTVWVEADRLEGYTEVTLVGDPDTRALAEWRRRLAGFYLPGLLLTIRPPGAGTERRAVWQGRDPVGGRPVAYVCRNFTCSLPLVDWEGLRRELERAHG